MTPNRLYVTTFLAIAALAGGYSTPGPPKPAVAQPTDAIAPSPASSPLSVPATAPTVGPAGRGAQSVFTEELTWPEVRDAVAGGKRTVIVPTGGVEQNGPYVVTGKHDYVVRATAEAIARKLGDALVAPVVPFVPEGNIDPPSGHMRFAGTISVTEDTYERLVTDICASYRAHGFEHIVLIGDSGENQRGLRAVAAKLNAAWGGARVLHVPEYYDHERVDGWLASQGIRQTPEGIHDNFAITATLAAVDPELIRAGRRQADGTFKINGVDLSPVERTAEWGRKIIDFRAEATVRAIRKAIAAKP